MTAAATGLASPARMPWIRALALAVASAGTLAAWIAFDVLAAGAGPWWFTLCALVVVATPLALFARSMRRRSAHRVAALVLVLLVVIAVLPWHPRKQFVGALHRVHPGMSVAEVDAVMADYRLGAGAKWRSADGRAPGGLSADGRDGALIYRWNDRDAAWDSDWGVVTIAAGCVVKVEFQPD